MCTSWTELLEDLEWETWNESREDWDLHLTAAGRHLLDILRRHLNEEPA